MKKLYTFLLAAAMSVASVNAQLDGSNCGEAKIIPSIPDSCAVNEHQLNAGEHEQWHKIMPETPELRLRVEKPVNEQAEEAHIHKIKLYKGGCGGLQLVEEKDIALNEELKIERTDIAVNEEHFIKLERDPNCGQCSAQGEAFYGLCVQKQLPAGSVCATAISLIPSDSCNATDYSMNGSEMWFNFVADSSVVLVSIPNTNSSEIENISVYSGICNTLILLNTFTFDFAGDTFPIFKLENLSMGNFYRIKIAFTSSGNHNISICMENVQNILPFVLTPCGNKCGANKIFNSDFEFGYLGFDNDLLYEVCNFGNIGNGSFAVCASANDVNGGWNQFGYGGSGKFLSCDPLQGKKQILWETHPIGVEQNTGYCFSAYVTSLPKTDLAIDPSVILLINGTVIASSGILLEGTANDWTEVSGHWNSGNSNTATLSIKNSTNGDQTFGCDIGIDHVSFVTENIIDNNILINSQYNCGTVTITASGSDSYLWSNGATSSSITLTTPGTYTFSVTGSTQGCTSTTDYVTVTVYPQLIVDAGPNHVICSGTEISVAVTGGTAPYTYLWSTGETTASIIPNNEALYSVTVTDANGCIDVDDIGIGFFEFTYVINTTPTCIGESMGVATLIGFPQDANILWSNGQTGQTATGLSQGTYSITITGGSSYYCTLSESAIIGAFPDPSVTISSTNTVCMGNNGTATANPSGGTFPYQYNWSNGSTTASISNLTAGIYSVTVTDANGCSTTNSVTIITVNNPPTVFLTTTPSCGSDGAVNITTLSGVSPYSFAWSNGATTQNISGLAAGTYTITVTDANGCTTVKSATVTTESEVKCCEKAHFANAGVPNRFKGIDIWQVSVTIYNLPGVLPASYNVNWTTFINSSAYANISIADNITVKTTASRTLTNKTINFGPNAYVKVPIGRSLTLDKCTLTAIPCAIMWQGIFVEGTRTIAQTVSTAQGKLTIQNNTLIEHALNAVRNYFPAGGGFFNFNSGGIIHATNSTFRNNKNAAYFWPYPIGNCSGTCNSVSFFKNCIFETTAALNDGSPAHDAFAIIWQNDIAGAGNIQAFEDNTFRNTRPVDLLNNPDRGDGIWALDAVFTVRKSAGKGGNNFIGLDYAIDLNKSLSNTTQSSVTIEGNFFSNNARGVNLTGNGGDYFISKNSFAQSATPSFLQFPVKYGVSGSGNTTLKIQQNTFTKQTIGCYIQNSGSAPLYGTNHAWSNRYTNCVRGLEFNQSNTAFEVLCNTFNNPANVAQAYWIVNNGNVKSPQGGCSGSTKPAGNKFDHTTTPQLADIFIKNNSIFNPVLQYFYYTANPIENPTQVNGVPCLGCNYTESQCGTQNTCNIAPQKVGGGNPNQIAQQLGSAIDLQERMVLIHQMLAALLESNQMDSIIPFLENVPDEEAKWLLVPEFIVRKKFIEAETTLNVLPKDNLEKQKRDEYYKVHIELGKTERIPKDMTLVEKSTVEQVAASETEIKHNAQAMLHFWFGNEYPPVLAVLDSSSNRMAAPEAEESENAPVIIAVDERENKVSSIYPNPNDGAMRMDYELKEGQKGELLIYDVTGRIVRQIILNNENNSLPINLTVGVYYYTVNLNGEKVLSDKLIIIK